jgi:nucleoside phosphorylase
MQLNRNTACGEFPCVGDILVRKDVHFADLDLSALLGDRLGDAGAAARFAAAPAFVGTGSGTEGVKGFSIAVWYGFDPL